MKRVISTCFYKEMDGNIRKIFIRPIQTVKLLFYKNLNGTQLKISISY